MSKGKWIAVLLLLSVITGLGYIKYQNNKKAAAKLMPQGGGKPTSIAVNGFVAEYSRLSSTLNTNGSVIAGDEVQLQPEVAGRITYLNVKEGVFVTKGTLIAKLNDADLQAQLKKLQTQVAIAQSSESRLAQLLKINGVSQLEYDVAVNTLNNIYADIELVNAQIAKTEVRAPFSGKLGLRNISLGAYVSPATVITSLQNLNELKIDITAPEKYASVIQVNDLMQCRMDGIEDPFSARVIAIEPQIDLNTRNLKVRAVIQQPSSRLIPGAFVKIQLKLKEISNAIMIPANAIIPDAQIKKVIVADSSKATFAVVETGIRTENEVQILSGIKVGDTIVTSGILQVKPKMDLKFKKVSRKSDIQ